MAFDQFARGWRHRPTFVAPTGLSRRTRFPGLTPRDWRVVPREPAAGTSARQLAPAEFPEGIRFLWQAKYPFPNNVPLYLVCAAGDAQAGRSQDMCAPEVRAGSVNVGDQVWSGDHRSDSCNVLK